MGSLGWAGRTMTWLRVGTHLVAVNLLWLLGTVLGLGVLGAGPATAAASPLLDAALRGEPSDALLRDFWCVYRARWVRANVLLAPFWLVAVLVALDVVALRVAAGPVATALAVGIGVVALYAVAASAFLYPVDERTPGGVRATWRVTLLAPALFPVTAAAVLLTVAVTVLLVWFSPVLLPLVGVSLPLALTGRLARARLDTALGRTAPAGTAEAGPGQAGSGQAETTERPGRL